MLSSALPGMLHGESVVQIWTLVTGAELAGPYALPYLSEEQLANPDEPPIGADWAATLAPNYFYSRAASIYSGSSEIQTPLPPAPLPR